ncbi:MAG: arginine deiminase-related protein [Planctomycetota bacterium]
MASPRILMCPPTYFGVHYEINPWMNTKREVDHPRSVRQWLRLRRILEDLGATIEVVNPVEGLPDMVFTANAALIYGRSAVLSRFKHPQRQGEEEHYRRRLEQDGLTVLNPPERFAFEGAGDALFCGDTLYAGYRSRSDGAGIQQIGDLLQVRALPLELVDPRYYHLDTCFCPLADDAAIYFSQAFDDYGRRVLLENISTLVDLDETEAQRFGCNAVVIGRNVVANQGCPRLRRALSDLNYELIETPLDEFVKAGGSAKCLTLRLDGEAAAAWRNA